MTSISIGDVYVSDDGETVSVVESDEEVDRITITDPTDTRGAGAMSGTWSMSLTQFKADVQDETLEPATLRVAKKTDVAVQEWLGEMTGVWKGQGPQTQRQSCEAALDVLDELGYDTDKIGTNGASTEQIIEVCVTAAAEAGARGYDIDEFTL